MSRLTLLAMAAALAAAACSSAPADTAAPANPVTVAPVTTSVPSQTTGVPPPTTTTADPATTTSTVADTVPATTTTSTIPFDELTLELEVVARGFSQPVFLTSPPDDDRLFVVDQPGVVWVIDDGDPETFLDISDRVRFGGEQGLLGLAFDPDYAASGKLYVNYTGAGGTTRVSEFTVTDSGNVADAGSERVVISIDQPASNHNGGMIAFGPDGYLWIGMGDGGRSNDAFGNGQNAATLLGSMLRIDPDTSGLDDPTCCEYAVPDTNPAFVAGGAADWAPEAWAIGLRNPWRFSFDGDRLFVADVGQGAVEEITVVAVAELAADPGVNFGWPITEGSDCFQAASCDTGGLVLPVHEYRHDEGCSITGGYVYRGASIPTLTGSYFFGDFCGGWIRSLHLRDGGEAEVREWFSAGAVPNLTSFGVDASGELYVLSANGTVHRLVAST